MWLIEFRKGNWTINVKNFIINLGKFGFIHKQKYYSAIQENEFYMKSSKNVLRTRRTRLAYSLVSS